MPRSTIILNCGLTLLVASASVGVAAELDCGSPEAYAKKGNWLNLPGCASNASVDLRAVGAAKTLSRAKFKLAQHLLAMGAGDYETAAEYADFCRRAGLNNWPMDEGWDDDPVLAAAKPAYENFCSNAMVKIAKANPRFVLKAVEQAYDYRVFGHAQLWDTKTAIWWLYVGKAAGIPDSTTVEGPNDMKISLGAFREELERQLPAEQERAADTAAAESAKWARHTAVVKGDRLEYLQMYQSGGLVYGPGRVRVSEPEEFRDAKALYVCLHDRNTVPETWIVRGARFDGDKQVGGEYKAVGVGGPCPSSAFQ